jgi:antitoxin CptB
MTPAMIAHDATTISCFSPREPERNQKRATVPDPVEIRRKRLLFRSWHRGTKETDLLLGSFAERHLSTFSEVQLDRYEALLENDDGRLYDWITGRSPPPPEQDHDVMRLLRDFRYRARPA